MYKSWRLIQCKSCLLRACCLSLLHGMRVTPPLDTFIAMASNSSSTQPMTNSLSQSVSENLSRENYILWKVQVLAAVCGAQLSVLLEESTPVSSKTHQVQQANKTMKKEANPAYEVWYAQDQQLLSFLLNSVTKEVLGDKSQQKHRWQELGVPSWGCLHSSLVHGWCT
jgi:hypothetical protein